MTPEILLAISATCCGVTAICNTLTGLELIRLRKALHSAISKIYASKPKDILRK